MPKNLPKIVVRRSILLMKAFTAAKAGNVEECGQHLVAACEDGIIDPVFDGIATTINASLTASSDSDFNPDDYMDGDDTSTSDTSLDNDNKDDMEDMDAKAKCKANTEDMVTDDVTISEEEEEEDPLPGDTVEIPASCAFLVNLSY